MEWFSVVSDFVHQAFKVRSKLLLPVWWLKHQSSCVVFLVLCDGQAGKRLRPPVAWPSCLWTQCGESFHSGWMAESFATLTLCVSDALQEKLNCAFSPWHFRAAYTQHGDFLNIIIIFFYLLETHEGKKKIRHSTVLTGLCVLCSNIDTHNDSGPARDLES